MSKPPEQVVSSYIDSLLMEESEVAPKPETAKRKFLDQFDDIDTDSKKKPYTKAIETAPNPPTKQPVPTKAENASAGAARVVRSNSRLGIESTPKPEHAQPQKKSPKSVKSAAKPEYDEPQLQDDQRQKLQAMLSSQVLQVEPDKPTPAPIETKAAPAASKPANAAPKPAPIQTQDAPVADVAQQQVDAPESQPVTRSAVHHAGQDRGPSNAAGVVHLNASSAINQQDNESTVTQESNSVAPTKAHKPSSDLTSLCQWAPNGRPNWAQNQFDVLLFKVSGLSLAVPLITLGQILNLSDSLTHLVGRSEWFMGMQKTSDSNVNVVNTSLFVMPDRYDASFLETAKYVVTINGLKWGLAVDEVQQPKLLSPDEVTWRVSRTSRPWLAGTVKSAMCALIDIPQMGLLLEQQSQSTPDVAQRSM